MHVRRAILVFALSSAMTGWGPAPSGPPSLYRQARRLMGTLCEIQVYHEDATLAAEAIDAGLDGMERVDRLLSNYVPDSPLSVMNRTASALPAVVSAELFEFVRECGRYVERTRGAFDPTVGPLVRAWGFTTPDPARPPEAVIDAAKAKVGFDKVRLDEGAHTVSYATPAMEIDPGGIGKGYAVDRAVDVLVRAGIGSALVSAGGSTLYAIGHPPEREGWRVAISDPANVETPAAIVVLRDASVSTSGVSYRSVRDGGRRFSHIFDPRTGDPVEGMCQATVVAQTATASDALSKAAFILTRAGLEDVLGDTAGAHALRLEGTCGAGAHPWITPWSADVFQDRPPAR